MIYLFVLVLLNLLILIHEGGHFLAARAVGIPIAGFHVGLGPKLWSLRRGKTEYCFRTLPLGGFVQPEVEDDAAFRAIPLRKRLFFFLGGPLGNLVTAVPLLALVQLLREGFSVYGVLVEPWLRTFQLAGQVLGWIPLIFIRPEAISGVIGIVAEGGRLAAAGMGLELAIFLSLSLAVFNLLPIPVLDGGHIVLSCLEERLPSMVRLRAPLTVVGLVLLVGLMLYATGHDVMRYWV